MAQGELDAALEQYRASLAGMVPFRDADRQHTLHLGCVSTRSATPWWQKAASPST